MSYLYAQMNAFCILILLLLYQNRKRSNLLEIDERLFNLELLLVSVLLLTDGAMWTLNNQTFTGARPLFQAVSLIYFLCMPAAGYLWLLYCDSKVYEDERSLRRRALLYAIPLLLSVLLNVSNLATGWIYTIDSANHYTRGPLLIVDLACSFVYLFFAGVLALRKANRTDQRSLRREYFLLAWFMLPPFLGGVLQVIFFGLSLIWVLTVFSLLVIFINVQNKQISTDALTGVNNRRAVDKYLAWKIKDIAPGQDLYAIVVDVDNFKTINDTYGHTRGDRELIRVASVLKTVCNGTNDFLARTGGDEFVIICQRESWRQVKELMELIERKMEENNRQVLQQYRLGLSMGCAAYGEARMQETDGFLTAADMRMYENKKGK